MHFIPNLGMEQGKGNKVTMLKPTMTMVSAYGAKKWIVSLKMMCLDYEISNEMRNYWVSKKHPLTKCNEGN